MTEAELTLARAVAALPGFALAEGNVVSEAGESGMKGARGVVVPSSRGPYLSVRWTGAPLDPGSWSETSLTHGTVLNLSHAPNGGILLGMLPSTYQLNVDSEEYMLTVLDHAPHHGSSERSLQAGIQVETSPLGSATWWSVRGATLCLVAAKALIVLGACK